MKNKKLTLIKVFAKIIGNKEEQIIARRFIRYAQKDWWKAMDFLNSLKLDNIEFCENIIHEISILCPIEYLNLFFNKATMSFDEELVF